MPTNLDRLPMIGDAPKEVNTLKTIEGTADNLPGILIPPTMNEAEERARGDLHEMSM